MDVISFDASLLDEGCRYNQLYLVCSHGSSSLACVLLLYVALLRCALKVKLNAAVEYNVETVNSVTRPFDEL